MDRDAVTQRVSRNLSAYMADRGINASELARRANVNATGVYDILSGKSRSPRLETLVKIAAALNISIIDILTGPDAALADRIRSVALRLDPKDQQRLLALAETFLTH